jgi:hypothetical protein
MEEEEEEGVVVLIISTTVAGSVSGAHSRQLLRVKRGRRRQQDRDGVEATGRGFVGNSLLLLSDTPDTNLGGRSGLHGGERHEPEAGPFSPLTCQSPGLGSSGQKLTHTLPQADAVMHAN